MLEVFAFAIRRGFDSPEKVAFAHIYPELRTRVLTDQSFSRRVGKHEMMVGHDFRSIMRHIEAILAFTDPETDE